MVGADKKKIVLVVPAYNEGNNLLVFLQAVDRILDGLPQYDWHVLFVDDGSTDNTWSVIGELAGANGRVSGIALSRNFGKEIALTAGAEAVDGADAVIFMDADLQHPPPVIAALVEQWNQGYQIVATRRTAIEYSWVRRIGSRLFYSLLNKLSDLDVEPKTTDFRLLDKKVLNALKAFKERTRLFRGLTDWMGFKKTYVTFAAPMRNSGDSSFSLRDLTRLAVNSLTTFSLIPLKLTGYLGLFVLSATVLVLGYMVVSQLFFGQIFTPLAYFVVFNTFLVGIILVALGLMALYIGHIHTEVVGRPLYIVQDRVGFHSPRAAAVGRYPVENMTMQHTRTSQ